LKKKIFEGIFLETDFSRNKKKFEFFFLSGKFPFCDKKLSHLFKNCYRPQKNQFFFNTGLRTLTFSTIYPGWRPGIIPIFFFGKLIFTSKEKQKFFSAKKKRKKFYFKKIHKKKLYFSLLSSFRLFHFSVCSMPISIFGKNFCLIEFGEVNY